MPKFDHYDEATALGDEDLLILSQGGRTKKLTGSTVKTQVGAALIDDESAGEDRAWSAEKIGGELADKAAAEHAHTMLDEGGDNEVSAADLKTLKDTTVPGKADKVSAATAGNLASFVAGGGLEDSGIAATAYDTLWVGAGAMIPCTTNGAAAITIEYGTNDIDLDVLAFDAGATEERAQFSVVMPENWDRGTVKAKFFWTNATGASAADTVEFGIKAGALSNDDAIDAALGTAVTVSDTVIAAGDLHVTAATAAITVGGTPALGDLVQFEVYRNTDGTDDMAEDAYLIGVLIQFTRNVAVSGW